MPESKEDILTLLGAEIKRRRTKKKLSVEDAAAAAGANVQTWYNWERGRFDLLVSRLPAIAAALGCKVKQLMGFELS